MDDARDDPDYEKVRQVLERAVARVCRGRMASFRDDIVQSALLRLLEIRRRGEHPAARTSSYLWQVAYTVTVDELRRVRRRSEIALAGPGAAPAALFAGDASVSEERLDVGRAIAACLGALVGPRRQAVSLHLRGFTAEEASRILAWDIKRIRNLVYRGLTDLRRCLESKGIRP